MFELIDTCPDANVQEAEYKRLLGYPGQHVLEGRSRELADATRKWYAENGRPWIYAWQTDDLELARDSVKMLGAEFASKQLHDQFHTAQVHNAVLVAVSAGKQCEEKAREFWEAGKPDEYFFMEMFGSAVVEHLITLANGRVCGWADSQAMVALPHYSPGYSGWEVSDQNRLWKLIRSKNGSGFPGELDVLDSGMLRPKKSLLAVVGITRHLDKVRSSHNLVPCENCALPGCQYRRAPYVHFPPQMEDVWRLQGGLNDDPDVEKDGVPVLTRDAKYSTNPRALRKWVQERLHLNPLPDGGIQAVFHYEGTTCSNMGQLLNYDYHIKLGPADKGYPVIESSCAPAPGDIGHTSQCEYLSNAEEFIAHIEKEKPLLGRPLNDVLSWSRPYNPSGCFCDLDRRSHKWGLVFEVIHYALVQREKANHGQNPAILS